RVAVPHCAVGTPARISGSNPVRLGCPRMARFVVEGGTPLHGEITPAGNKNEALPLIAASLLTDDPVTLHNVPRIRDVRGMLEVASALGASVEDLDPHTTRITAKDLR